MGIVLRSYLCLVVNCQKLFKDILQIRSGDCMYGIVLKGKVPYSGYMNSESIEMWLNSKYDVLSELAGPENESLPPNVKERINVKYRGPDRLMHVYKKSGSEEKKIGSIENPQREIAEIFGLIGSAPDEGRPIRFEISSGKIHFLDPKGMPQYPEQSGIADKYLSFKMNPLLGRKKPELMSGTIVDIPGNVEYTESER